LARTAGHNKKQKPYETVCKYKQTLKFYGGKVLSPPGWWNVSWQRPRDPSGYQRLSQLQSI